MTPPSARRRPTLGAMRRFRMYALLNALAVVAILVASASNRVQSPVGLTVSALPTPAHIVVVVEENRSAASRPPISTRSPAVAR